MVSVRIENKAAFNIIGMKTWISDTDNNEFGEFWELCHRQGDIGKIKKCNQRKKLSQTQSAILGLSCTERDPNVRSFYFYIAVETNETSAQGNYEIYHVKPYQWAIFQNEGHDFKALMECEMYAWKEWLPRNDGLEHDNGPELEVYFEIYIKYPTFESRQSQVIFPGL
jgi:AraC family transcriptional regulator